MAHNYFLPRGLRKRASVSPQLLWRIEAAILGTLLIIIRLLPLKLALKTGGTIFAVVGPRTPRAAKARNNLAIICPGKNAHELDQLTRDSFRHFGTGMTELMRLDQIWRERDTRIEFALRAGATAPNPDRRTVFVTAHCGPWELTPLIGPHYGVTLPVIYAPEENPYVNNKLKEMRRTFGSDLVSRDGGIRMLMRALDKGHSIGLTVDTRMDAGEPLPFFGEDALTNTGPARLALRYGCEMVPVFAERLPGARFRVSIYPPIRPRDITAAAPEQGRDMTCQLNGIFETWIRAKPDQWLCVKRRWPESVYQRLSS